MNIRTIFSLFFVISVFYLNIEAIAQHPEAPESATILFNGKDFSHWTNCDDGEVKWEIKDGVMQVVPDTLYSCEKIQGIKTKKNYQDFQLHVEFRLLEPKSNSGIYIHRRYELQIDNTFNEADNQYMGGSIYRQKLPDVNMGKPQGEWQYYDIIFRAPRYNTSEIVTRKIEDARITVIHNGVVIHNNVIVHTKTGVGYPESPEFGPIMLQDHGSLVQFRNIWIVSNEEKN